MVDIVRRSLDTGAFDPFHGVRPHLHVTFTAAAMRAEPGAPPPRTATGDHISPKVLQRLLCDASLTAILVDGNGAPLKMGRTKRTATPAQWVALVARDGGCCFPACTRPALYTQAHHFPEWINDGAADLDKMGLFCTVHHHYLHDKGWRAQLGPDGHVEVIPHTWIDPLQRPRRNWALAPPTRPRQQRTTRPGTVTIRGADRPHGLGEAAARRTFRCDPASWGQKPAGREEAAMTRTRRITTTVGMLCLVGGATVTGVFAFGDRAGDAVVAAPPEAGGDATGVVPDVDGADTRWIVTPQAQRAKDVIDEELKKRFGEGSEETGPRGPLERGLIGIANDHLAQQVVVITDPAAEIDGSELEDELHRLTGNYQRSRPETRKLGVRVQEGCHPAADLIEAYEVLRARDWHPRADETPGTSGLFSYDSPYHVSLPTDAREVGEALEARLGPVITLTYTDDLPRI